MVSLCSTPGMAGLMTKLSRHDRPRRAQGKIMNMIHAVNVGDLIRSLPSREATVIDASAAAPHLVSITAGGDPNLRITNAALATHLAMRLSVTQLPVSPSTGAAMTTTYRCPMCGGDHANAHLDGCISCGRPGSSTALRTPWHNDVAGMFHMAAKMVGIPCTLEPPSIAVGSNIRGDLKFSRISTRRADQYADVVTYERVKTTDKVTYEREAALPGWRCDIAERFKIGKHHASVVADDSNNEFTPIAVNEYGQLGPQALDLLDRVVSRSQDPVTLKTYIMRRLAVATAVHVHRQLHGRVRGHEAMSPATGRTADADHINVVPDDVAEQTVCANDEMVDEERGRPPRGGAGGAAGLGQVAVGGGEGLVPGEAGAAGGVLAGAAGGDAGAEAMEVAMDDPLMLLS